MDKEKFYNDYDKNKEQNLNDVIKMLEQEKKLLMFLEMNNGLGFDLPNQLMSKICISAIHQYIISRNLEKSLKIKDDVVSYDLVKLLRIYLNCDYCRENDIKELLKEGFEFKENISIQELEKVKKKINKFLDNTNLSENEKKFLVLYFKKANKKIDELTKNPSINKENDGKIPYKKPQIFDCNRYLSHMVYMFDELEKIEINDEEEIEKLIKKNYYIKEDTKKEVLEDIKISIEHFLNNPAIGSLDSKKIKIMEVLQKVLKKELEKK